MNDEQHTSTETGEAEIARLLARVGTRPEPAPEAMQIAREAALDAWKDTLAERRRERNRWAMIGMAASLVLSLGFAWQLLIKAPQSESQIYRLANVVADVDWQSESQTAWQPVVEATTLRAGDRLQSGPGSYAALTTDTGLSVRLDHDTLIELQADSTLRLHHGAVYIDAPGELSLAVLTPWGEARDIGTRYEVRVTGNDWQVQVRDGRVEMSDDEAGVAVVGAGERRRADGSRFISDSVSPADASWSWTHAAISPMVIEGKSLADYLAWWSLESGLAVSFAEPIDQAIAEQTVLHGSLDGISLEEGLLVTLESAGYAVVDRSEKGVILAR